MTTEEFNRRHKEWEENKKSPFCTDFTAILIGFPLGAFLAWLIFM